MQIKDQYLTTGKAAELCHVTRYTIRNWVISGKLGTQVTAGGHRRIAKKDLLSFIETNIKIQPSPKGRIIHRTPSSRKVKRPLKGQNIFQKGLFSSGKYLATLKNYLLK